MREKKHCKNHFVFKPDCPACWEANQKEMKRRNEKSPENTFNSPPKPQAKPALNSDSIKEEIDLTVRVRKGAAAFQSGNVDEAIHITEEVLSVDPKHSQALADLALFYHARKDFPKSADTFRRAIAIDPGNGYVWHHLGFIFLEIGKNPEAVYCFEKCPESISTQGKEIAFNMRSKGIYAKKPEFLDGGNILDSHQTEISPERKQCVLNNEVVHLINSGRLTQAEQKCREAIALEPTLKEARTNLIIILNRMGADEELEDPHREILKFDPNDLKCRSSLAAHLDSIGKTTDAKALYLDVIHRDPNNLHALLNLGGLLKRKGILNDALDLFRRAIKSDPSDPHARFKLGMLLLDMGRYREAVNAMQEACFLEPNHFMYLNGLDLAQQVLRGEVPWPDEARKTFESDPNVMRNVRILKSSQGTFIMALDKAPGPFFGIPSASLIPPINRYKTANLESVKAKKTGQNVSFLDGIQLAKRRKLLEAEDYFRLMYKDNPDCPEAQHNLVVNLMQQGALEEALKVLKPQWDDKEKKDFNTLLLQAHVYYEKGDYVNADG